MPITDPGPTVVRRQLGRRLRTLREAAKVSPAQVQESGIASTSKLWRIETGKLPVRVGDVLALCRLYGVSAEETDELVAGVSGTTRRVWWDAYRGALPEWFKLYLGLEALAARISIFEDSVVPGELQTPDYARAVFRAAHPDENDEQIAQRVQLRSARQAALFGRGQPPQLTAILGEAALVRGAPDVMAAQLAHLRELDERDYVRIEVVPFAVGHHAAMTGAFRVLDFDDDPDVVYLEGLTGGHYLEKPEELEEHRHVLDLIRKTTISIGAYAP